MRLRKHIKPPQKYRDEIEDQVRTRSVPEPKPEPVTEPIPDSLPVQQTRHQKKKPDFVPYNPDLPPAVFPTLNSIHPATKKGTLSSKNGNSTAKPSAGTASTSANNESTVDSGAYTNQRPWVPPPMAEVMWGPLNEIPLRAPAGYQSDEPHWDHDMTGANTDLGMIDYGWVQSVGTVSQNDSSSKDKAEEKKVEKEKAKKAKWKKLSASHRFQILHSMAARECKLTEEQKQELSEHRDKRNSILEAERSAQTSLQAEVSGVMLNNRHSTMAASEYRALFDKHFGPLLCNETENYFISERHELCRAQQYLRKLGEDPIHAGEWREAGVGLPLGLECISSISKEPSQYRLKNAAQVETPSKQQVRKQAGPVQGTAKESKKRLSIKFVRKADYDANGQLLRSSTKSLDDEIVFLGERVRASMGSSTSPYTSVKVAAVPRTKSPSLDGPPLRLSKHDHNPATPDVAKRYYISPSTGAKVPLTSSGKNTPSDKALQRRPSQDITDVSRKLSREGNSQAEVLERLRVDSLKYRSRQDSGSTRQVSEPEKSSPTQNVPSSYKGEVNHKSARKVHKPDTAIKGISGARRNREPTGNNGSHAENIAEKMDANIIQPPRTPERRPSSVMETRKTLQAQAIATMSMMENSTSPQDVFAGNKKRRRSRNEEEAHDLLVKFGARNINPSRKSSREAQDKSHETEGLSRLSMAGPDPGRGGSKKNTGLFMPSTSLVSEESSSKDSVIGRQPNRLMEALHPQYARTGKPARKS